MILTCPSCRKSFRTDPNLFGAGPRTVACGFCRHQWQADGSALMTDQQFYDMRMRQMAAAGQLPQAQPAQSAASPAGGAPAPEPTAAPAPPPEAVPEPQPEPVVEQAVTDPDPEDTDQAFAAALAEAAADSEMRSSDQTEPDGDDLIVDAEGIAPDTKEKSGKRRFGLFGGDGDKSGDKKAAKATGKKEKKPRMPKPARRRAGVLTWVMWLLFVVLVGGVCAAIYLLPAKIVSIWPPAEHLYSTLQMPVSAPGNEDAKSAAGETASPAADKAKAKSSGRTSGDEQTEDNADEPKNKVGLALTVQGVKRRRSGSGRVSVTAQLHLKNISKRSRIVPQVVIKFIDVNGESVFEKRVNWLTGPVSPGGEKHTDVQIDNVPESAVHLSATFDVPGRG